MEIYPMNQIEQIAQKICDFVTDPTLIEETGAPSGSVQDLAEQYAKECESANQRLYRCVDLLDKGMRSEAIQVAEQPPPLLDVVVALDLPVCDQWSEFCRKSGLVVPVAIFEDGVNRLNQEYSKGTALEPLIHEYRKLVHAGTLQEKISILRRIRALDPENPIWPENLRPLEREQLKVLIDEAKGAIADRDLAMLQGVVAKVKANHWVDSVPNELKERLDTRLDELQLEKQNARAQTVLSQLTLAIAEKRRDGLQSLLNSWNQLEGDITVQPNAEQKNALKVARKVIRKDLQQAEKERGFERAVEELSHVVELPNADKTQLENSLAKLTQFSEFDQPAALSAQASSRIAAMEVQQQRSTRLKIIGTLAALLLIGVVIGFVSREQSRQRELSTLDRTLRELVDRKDYDEATTLLSTSLERHPYFAGSVPLAALESEIQAGIEKRDEDFAAFGKIQEVLAASRENSFPEEMEELDHLVKAASAKALDRRTASVAGALESREED